MAMAPPASAVSLSARPAVAVTGRPRAASASVRAVAAAEGAKWWAPLVEWSGQADYIEPAAPVLAALVVVEEAKRRPDGGEGAVAAGADGGTESFHDAMYHSAIASRLARSST